MKLGYIGLGKMGRNMVERLVEQRHDVVVFDVNEEAVQEVVWKGAVRAQSIWGLVGLLERPRTVWLMAPHEQVDAILHDLVPILHDGDIIIDGGNSFYKDSVRRAEELKAREVYFLDAGVSGGPSGAREGACVMVGGDEKIFKKHEPLFRDIAAKDGYLYVGTAGAGHFVKMVHNGIEYGMMQAIAEGFEVLKKSPYGFNLTKIADLYNHKSVIESRLVSWLWHAYEEYGNDLETISSSVAQSGEGLWTVEAAKKLDIQVPVIESAVEFRNKSAEKPSYMGKVLSALRNQFGGHTVSSK